MKLNTTHLEVIADVAARKLNVPMTSETRARYADLLFSLAQHAEDTAPQGGMGQGRRDRARYIWQAAEKQWDKAMEIPR